MQLRLKLSLLYVGMFMLITALVLTYIYFSYSHFRQEEFYFRLQQKAKTTAGLLFHVQEVDKALLKIIDRNTINQLYDEKILVFDLEGNLAYSSLDDEPIIYNKKILEQINSEGYIEFTDSDGDEIVGLKYDGDNKDYLVLASAYDTYGKRKLNNLLIEIIIAFVVGSLLIFISSFYYIRQIFHPIEALDKAINDITENQLEKRVHVKADAKDGLSHIAKNFNEMMDRLQQAFVLQNTFVQHTSHELKTPLSIISADIDKLLSKSDQYPQEVVSAITNIQDITHSQAKMIDELLLLQKLRTKMSQHHQKVRIDELLFEEIDLVKTYASGFQVEINFNESITKEGIFEIEANPVLVKLAIRNLLENAVRYSIGETVKVECFYGNNTLSIDFINAGDESLPHKMIFQPFYRHTNKQHVKGYGLGLALVKQIMEYHLATVVYRWKDNYHHFTLRFPSLRNF